MKKYVWLNLNTGEFSNSWNESDYEKDSIVWKHLEETKENANSNGWKLIEYTCLNDQSFDFYNKMKVVTNTN